MKEKGIPRVVEVGLAFAGLFVVMPVIALAAAAVKATSRGPALFRQERVGRYGRPFTLYKLRTMRHTAGGPQVTAGDDERITSVGLFLRRTKLDELPELWNIIRGDMSLVGPRPEVPKYVDPARHPLWTRILEARPGITDPVTLRLRNEESLMAEVTMERDLFYREVLQPFKLKGYAEYLDSRTWRTDLSVIIRTLLAVIVPEKACTPSADELVMQTKGKWKVLA